jgi:RNA polymerase sigma factor (sigma-70 family)
MFRVPPQDLYEEEGFNQRDYNSPECVAQIEGFAKAYAAGEYVPPLVVRIDPSSGRKLIVEGHQRRRGALLAISRGVELPLLDCLPFRGNDVDRIVVQGRSERGLKLTPLGLSKLYLMLLRKGLTNTEIATRMDVSVTTVESMLSLAEAPSDVQTMVKDGTVAASVAIDAVRKYGDKAGEKLAEKLVQAKAKGKTSVKASAVKDWAPPRKVSLNLFSSITPVYKAIAEDSGLKELLDSVLAPREAKVIRMRFGIEMDADHTLEEVGKQFDVTRERIRQIEAKALARLRHPAKDNALRDYMDVTS